MFDQEEDHAPGEKEEDKLRQRVRGIDVPGRVHDRSRYEEDERGPDWIACVKARPDRVDHVGYEKADKDLDVRNGHRARTGTRSGLLSYAAAGLPLPSGTYNILVLRVRYT